MKLSPVVSESDELIRAIEDDVIRHDDNWTLDSLDTEQLEQDWQHIVHDIRQDPNWSDLDNTE